MKASRSRADSHPCMIGRQRGQIHCNQSRSRPSTWAWSRPCLTLGSTGFRLVLTLLSEKAVKITQSARSKRPAERTRAGMTLSWLNSPDRTTANSLLIVWNTRPKCRILIKSIEIIDNHLDHRFSRRDNVPRGQRRDGRLAGWYRAGGQINAANCER
jgi:hypothetical protein